MESEKSDKQGSNLYDDIKCVEDIQHHHTDQHLRDILEMQRLDPDWEFAEQHGKATRPGQLENFDTRRQCICCMREIRQQPIPLCENTKELQFLGGGFPLYYTFMKYTIGLNLLLIGTYACLTLYWSIQQNQNFCDNIDLATANSSQVNFCSSFLISYSNTFPISTDELIIRLTSYIIHMLFLLYIRDTLRKTRDYYDERNTTYSHYSVLMVNLPTKAEIAKQKVLAGKNIGKIVEDFFNDGSIFSLSQDDGNDVQKQRMINDLINKNDKKVGFEIDRLVLIGSFQQIEQSKAMKSNLVKQLQIVAKDLLIHDKNEISLNQRKQIIQMMIREINQQIKYEILIQYEEAKQKDVECDKAIVCFKTEKTRKQVELIFSKCPRYKIQEHFGQYAKDLKIGRAPQPNEIIWKNINIKAKYRNRRIVVSWTIFLMATAASFTAFYYLLLYKNYLIGNSQGTSYLYGYAVVYLFLFILINFSKFVFRYFSIQLVQLQKPKNGEDYQFSFCFKYLIGYFLMTAAMPIIVEGFTYGNFYNQRYGVIEEESILFFFNAFYTPFVWAVNPWYIYNWLRREFRKDDKQKKSYMTQEEANVMMEYPQFLMGKSYGQILQNSWFAFFFVSIVPLGCFLSIIGLSLYYWIDKYNLLRKSSISQGVSSNLSIRVLKLLDFTLVLRPVGTFIFDKYVRGEIHPLTFVEFGLGVMYMIIPLNVLLDQFNKQKFRNTQQLFRQYNHQNLLSYEINYPVTKIRELQKNLQFIYPTRQEHENDKERERDPSSVRKNDGMNSRSDLNVQANGSWIGKSSIIHKIIKAQQKKGPKKMKGGLESVLKSKVERSEEKMGQQ